MENNLYIYHSTTIVLRAKAEMELFIQRDGCRPINRSQKCQLELRISGFGGLFLRSIVFFSLLKVLFRAVPYCCSKHFLKPNIGSRASSRKKKERKREKEGKKSEGGVIEKKQD